MNALTQSSYMALGLLANQAMSGYDLKKTMCKIANFYWSESNAQIYPILKKLEEADLLSSTIDDDSGARQKRIYTITTAGKKVLLEWLQQDCTLTPYREEILLKLGRGQHCDDQHLLDMLNNYKQQIEDKLTLHQEIIQHIKEAHADKLDQPYLFMVHDHVRCILQTKLDWCERTLVRLQSTSCHSA